MGALHIARPDEPMPDEMEFVHSAGWQSLLGAADRGDSSPPSAGTPLDVATAAAKRTTAFYTGEPEESP